MNPSVRDNPAALAGRIAGEVRGQALWAGVVAALVLYYAFRAPWTTYGTAGAIFVYSLQIGGVALAFAAALLLTGWTAALACVGIVDLAMGAALVLSGVMGMGLLYIFFGIVFLASGWHNLTQYRSLGKLWRMAEGQIVTPADENIPRQSLATRLNNHDTQSTSRPDTVTPEPPAAESTNYRADALDEPPPHSPPPHSADTPAFTTPDGTETPTGEDVEAPPEGFLASFADPPDRDPKR